MRGSNHVTLITTTIIVLAFGVLMSATGCNNQTTPKVVIETSLGHIVLELDKERTPTTTANFLKYVDDHFYDGIIFHRVIKGFMVQAGGFDANSQPKKPTYPPIANESQNSAANARGTIAMARTNDRNSATSQFFINLADNNRLDFSGGLGGYCVFGHVVEGMDIVDKIANTPVQRSRIAEAQPIENVAITTIRRK